MSLKNCRAGKTTMLGLLALGAPLAAMDAPTTYLWDSGGQLSIARASAWGNGIATTSRSVTYNGDDVLQFTTRNFNEGVMFDIAPPVDLNNYKQNGFLRLRLRFRDAAPVAVGGVPGVPGPVPEGGAPTIGGPAMGAAPQVLPLLVNFQQRPGFGGAFPGAPGAFPGAPGAAPGGEGGVPAVFVPVGPPPQETRIRRLQLNFVLEKGVATGFIDIPADLEKIQPDDAGWRLFLVPVKELRVTPNAQGLAQRLIITSDKEDTFFMAQAAMVIETGQMEVMVRRPADQRGAQIAELNVKPGLVTLVADVEAGTADPLIEWNFDADNVNPDLRPPQTAPAPGAAPGAEGGAPPEGGAPGGVAAPAPVAGPRVDARGLVAKFEYPNEEQDYRVEVTVTDRAGKKAPVKASMLIHVRG